MKKSLSILASLLLVIAFIAMANTNRFTAQKATTPTLKVGDIAPDFSLQNIDDNMVALSDFKDAKGFIINFTCNTCPFAVLYEERVVALQEKYAKKGYPVINIMPNDIDVKPGDSFQNMKIRAEKVGYEYYLNDAAQKVYPTYGASRTPHILLLDAKRKVRYIGAIDDNAQDATAVQQHYLEDAITAMEAGKEPEPNFTKAIGCSIKVKK
ncbi:MAG: thioredoxin family protein [Bacteroidota bacterium]